MITNELGLHIGAAARLVELANAFPCDIRVANEGRHVNGKSIMGVLMLGASQGATLVITASGDRALEAADALVRLVANRFEDTP